VDQSPLRVPLQRDPRRVGNPRARDARGREGLPDGGVGSGPRRHTDSAPWGDYAFADGQADVAASGAQADGGNDIYLPHTYEEVKGLVRPGVITKLDPELGYGLWWYGRHEVSEPDGNGGKRYTKREVRKPRPREDQIAVPVPAALPCGLVETARVALAANKGTERKYLTRKWELRGLLRCSCGGKMGTQTTKPKWAKSPTTTTHATGVGN
jgi:hypothetical protein